MSELGFRSIDEMVGQSQKLNMNKAIDHFKAKGLDLSRILYKPDVPSGYRERNIIPQDHKLENVLDFKIIDQTKIAITKKINQTLEFPIKNTDRTVGTILSNEISKLYGANGLTKNLLN